MIKKYFKKYKLDYLQQIKQNYSYIYILRYNDLTINENILLKKKIKELKFNSIILKQKLLDKVIYNIKSPGSILIIYGNENLNFKNLLIFKKIELIYLINNNIIYSNLKLQRILSNNNISLNISIIKPFFTFLYYLRKI